jgi:TolB-like protein
VAVPAHDDADAREADYRLEGGVRQAAGMLRATMRLIDARSHCLIWSARFDHADDDVLRAQEALAASIGVRLKQEVFAASANAAFAHAHAAQETFKIS